MGRHRMMNLNKGWIWAAKRHTYHTRNMIALVRHMVGATLAVALACCIITILFPFAPIVSAHTSANSGRIFGQLLNGTKNKAPVVGQQVTLQMAQGDTARDLTTITTAAHGTFSFDGLNTDKTINYAVYTRYQGAQYYTDLISLDSKPVQQVSLVVYEATTSTRQVAIVQATILLHKPDTQVGALTMSEIFIFNNLDTRTYVGSLDASAGKPNALRFSLPRGARNISLSKGFDGYKTILVDRGFATDAAVPPGSSEFAFSFEVPYATSTYDFSYVVTYPTVQLSLLVPPDVHASSSGGLTSQGLITADQHPYQLFQGKTLLPGAEVHIQLEGLSVPASTSNSTLNPGTLWLIVGLLVMLAILFVSFFLYRSSKRQRLAQTTVPAKLKRGASQEREQKLLQELLELDTAFEAGKLTKAQYQERRARTKARLRSIMSEAGDPMPKQRAMVDTKEKTAPTRKGKATRSNGK